MNSCKGPPTSHPPWQLWQVDKREEGGGGHVPGQSVVQESREGLWGPTMECLHSAYMLWAMCNASAWIAQCVFVGLHSDHPPRRAYPWCSCHLCTLLTFATADAFCADPLCSCHLCTLLTFATADAFGADPLCSCRLCTLLTFTTADAFCADPLCSCHLCTLLTFATADAFCADPLCLSPTIATADIWCFCHPHIAHTSHRASLMGLAPANILSADLWVANVFVCVADAASFVCSKHAPLRLDVLLPPRPLLLAHRLPKRRSKWSLLQWMGANVSRHGCPAARGAHAGS